MIWDKETTTGGLRWVWLGMFFSFRNGDAVFITTAINFKGIALFDGERTHSKNEFI